MKITVLFLTVIAFLMAVPALAVVTTTTHLGDPDVGPDSRIGDDAKGYFTDPASCVATSIAAADSIIVWEGTHTDSVGTSDQVMYLVVSNALIAGEIDDIATGQDSCIISGSSTRRCLTVGPLVNTLIRSVQFASGKESGTDVGIHRGGLVYIAPTARPTFDNVKFNGGNCPAGDGGSVYLAYDAFAVFDSCTFYGAPTAKKGPVIYAESPDSLIVLNSTFVGMSGGNGPQIVIHGDAASDVKFENCTFDGALDDLFEIEGDFNTFYIVHCWFQNNGGAILNTSTMSKAVRVDSLRIIARY